ncbi:MAG: YibE/F family protein [Spirochaetia bacterium]|nr:YibE/F family protein [Spirochaetia bacterium]
MEKKNFNVSKQFSIFLTILTLLIAFIPNSFNSTQPLKTYKAKVVSVDNTNLEQYGISKVGSQSLKVELLNGEYKGQIVKGVNYLMGKMELDSVYENDMKVLVKPYIVDNKINSVTLLGYYRIDIEIILMILFGTFLICFAGWTGFKALISFCFSAVMIFKILLPMFLLGFNPIIISMIVVIILSFVIIFIIGDFSKKGFAAFLGTVSGVVVTCLLSIIFTDLLKISGAVKPFMETLLYSGYSNINITDIFISGIFMAASGALMDISMDVATSIEEVYFHNSQLTQTQLILSGLRVGRTVIGTMTTTLLLAYSSSYMGFLLVFLAQGTSLIQILNLNYVSSEILNTVIGSFGLVLTAPLTAIIAGILYSKGNTQK